MTYKLFYITICVISFVTLWNRYQLKHHNFTPSVLALMVEYVKAIIMYLLLRFYFKQQSIVLFRKNIKEYMSISCLYIISNILLFTIFKNISAGTFLVLSQHRIIWTVIISKILLNKKYTEYEIVACVVNFSSTILLIYDKAQDQSTYHIYFMVVMHGFVSALASVIIQKTMQSSSIDFENYCLDSLQLYLIGLPIYGIWILFVEDNIFIPPWPITCSMVIFTALQGMFIGAIFKYYSALHRTIMQSIVLLIVMSMSQLVIDSEERLDYNFYSLSFIILCTVFIFIRNRIDWWMITIITIMILNEYIKEYNSEKKLR